MKISRAFAMLSLGLSLGLVSCQNKDPDFAGGDPLGGLEDYPFDDQGNYIGEGQRSRGSRGTRSTGTVAATTSPPVSPGIPDGNYQPITGEVAAPPPPPPPVSPSVASRSGGSSTGSTASRPRPTSGRPAISYTVRSGDTLSGIASRHGTTVAALRSANGIRGDMIRIGQRLKVPGKLVASSGTSSRGGGSASSGGTYTVKSGDSLWLIANRNKTTVAKLKAANNLTSETIKPGQKLRLP
jgi:LysM repeat protein